MRRRRISFFDDSNDLFNLVHQFGLVLQAACGVDHSTSAFDRGAADNALKGSLRTPALPRHEGELGCARRP